jgi:hypothetical protein
MMLRMALILTSIANVAAGLGLGALVQVPE